MDARADGLSAAWSVVGSSARRKRQAAPHQSPPLLPLSPPLSTHRGRPQATPLFRSFSWATTVHSDCCSFICKMGTLSRFASLCASRFVRRAFPSFFNATPTNIPSNVRAETRKHWRTKHRANHPSEPTNLILPSCYATRTASLKGHK